MRLIATSDTHVKVDTTFIPDGDVFIHAGDLMTTGYPDDWKEQLEWLAELPHEHKFYVPGNHDFHIMLYPGPALQDMRRIGVMVLGFPGNHRFRTARLPNGLVLGGCPFVPGLDNRWAFGEKFFESFGEQPEIVVMDLLQKCDILVTHSPIRGILDKSDRNNEHAGSYEFRSALSRVAKLETLRTRQWIHGHIHERYGSDIDPETLMKIYNVAMCDRENQHVNPPLVIDF